MKFNFFHLFLIQLIERSLKIEVVFSIFAWDLEAERYLCPWLEV